MFICKTAGSQFIEFFHAANRIKVIKFKMNILIREKTFERRSLSKRDKQKWEKIEDIFYLAEIVQIFYCTWPMPRNIVHFIEKGQVCDMQRIPLNHSMDWAAIGLTQHQPCWAAFFPSLAMSKFETKNFVEMSTECERKWLWMHIIQHMEQWACIWPAKKTRFHSNWVALLRKNKTSEIRVCAFFSVLIDRN